MLPSQGAVVSQSPSPSSSSGSGGTTSPSLFNHLAASQHLLLQQQQQQEQQHQALFQQQQQQQQHLHSHHLHHHLLHSQYVHPQQQQQQQQQRHYYSPSEATWADPQQQQQYSTPSSSSSASSSSSNKTLVGIKKPKAKRVCTRCKASKTVCDDERPCRRCIRLGYEDQCVDAEPRVAQRRQQAAQHQHQPSTTTTTSSASSSPGAIVVLPGRSSSSSSNSGAPPATGGRRSKLPRHSLVSDVTTVDTIDPMSVSPPFLGDNSSSDGEGAVNSNVFAVPSASAATIRQGSSSSASSTSSSAFAAAAQSAASFLSPLMGWTGSSPSAATDGSSAGSSTLAAATSPSSSSSSASAAVIKGTVQNLFDPDGSLPTLSAGLGDAPPSGESFLGDVENALLEGFLDGFLKGSVSLGTQLSMRLTMERVDGTRLQHEYCNHTYEELVRWHDRIITGAAQATTPMYILYCRHYLNMVASYNLHSPEEIEKRRDFLMANLPDSQLTHAFMEDQEAPENHEQLGDKITEMVYQRMPLAVLKLKNNHFLLQPTYVNSYAVAMFGYEMEEVFAKSDQLFLMRALHPDCWTNLALAICTAVVNKHEVFQVKTVGRHKDGSYFDLIATAQLDWSVLSRIPSGATVYLQKA